MVQLGGFLQKFAFGSDVMISKTEPKEQIIKTLRRHPEGLMLIEIAKITGMNRFTVTKYVHELIGSGSIFQKKAAAARLCYLKDVLKNENVSKIKNNIQTGGRI
jgi:predicted transcriptional regulator